MFYLQNFRAETSGFCHCLWGFPAPFPGLPCFLFDPCALWLWLQYGCQCGNWWDPRNQYFYFICKIALANFSVSFLNVEHSYCLMRLFSLLFVFPQRILFSFFLFLSLFFLNSSLSLSGVDKWDAYFGCSQHLVLREEQCNQGSASTGNSSIWSKKLLLSAVINE